MNIKQFSILFFIVISTIGIFFFMRSSERKKNREVIVVGTSADYPPYAFIDPKTNKVVGFDIDVVKEVAQLLGKKCEVKDIPFASLIFDLLSGDIDVIAAGMTPTARRSRGVLFSQKYLEADPLVVVTKKSYKNINTLQDLKNKVVVVNTGYTADLYLSDKANINLIRLRTPAESFMALETGTVDAYVCAKSSLATFLTKNRAQEFNIITLPNTGDDYSLVVAKQNYDLLHQINKALKLMKQSGILQNLKKKWNLE